MSYKPKFHFLNNERTYHKTARQQQKQHHIPTEPPSYHQYPTQIPINTTFVRREQHPVQQNIIALSHFPQTTNFDQFCENTLASQHIPDSMTTLPQKYSQQLQQQQALDNQVNPHFFSHPGFEQPIMMGSSIMSPQQPQFSPQYTTTTENRHLFFPPNNQPPQVRNTDLFDSTIAGVDYFPPQNPNNTANHAYNNPVQQTTIHHSEIPPFLNAQPAIIGKFSPQHMDYQHISTTSEFNQRSPNMAPNPQTVQNSREFPDIDSNRCHDPQTTLFSITPPHNNEIANSDFNLNSDSSAISPTLPHLVEYPFHIPQYNMSKLAAITPESFEESPFTSHYADTGDGMIIMVPAAHNRAHLLEIPDISIPTHVYNLYRNEDGDSFQDFCPASCTFDKKTHSFVNTLKLTNNSRDIIDSPHEYRQSSSVIDTGTENILDIRAITQNSLSHSIRSQSGYHDGSIGPNTTTSSLFTNQNSTTQRYNHQNQQFPHTINSQSSYYPQSTTSGFSFPQPFPSGNQTSSQPSLQSFSFPYNISQPPQSTDDLEYNSTLNDFKEDSAPSSAQKRSRHSLDISIAPTNNVTVPSFFAPSSQNQARQLDTDQYDHDLHAKYVDNTNTVLFTSELKRQRLNDPRGAFNSPTKPRRSLPTFPQTSIHETYTPFISPPLVNSTDAEQNPFVQLGCDFIIPPSAVDPLSAPAAPMGDITPQPLTNEFGSSFQTYFSSQQQHQRHIDDVDDFMDDDALGLGIDAGDGGSNLFDMSDDGMGDTLHNDKRNDDVIVGTSHQYYQSRGQGGSGSAGYSSFSSSQRSKPRQKQQPLSTSTSLVVTPTRKYQDSPIDADIYNKYNQDNAAMLLMKRRLFQIMQFQTKEQQDLIKALPLRVLEFLAANVIINTIKPTHHNDDMCESFDDLESIDEIDDSSTILLSLNPAVDLDQFIHSISVKSPDLLVHLSKIELLQPLLFPKKFEPLSKKHDGTNYNFSPTIKKTSKTRISDNVIVEEPLTDEDDTDQNLKNDNITSHDNNMGFGSQSDTSMGDFASSVNSYFCQPMQQHQQTQQRGNACVIELVSENGDVNNNGENTNTNTPFKF